MPPSPGFLSVSASVRPYVHHVSAISYNQWTDFHQTLTDDVVETKMD